MRNEIIIMNRQSIDELETGARGGPQVRTRVISARVGEERKKETKRFGREKSKKGMKGKKSIRKKKREGERRKWRKREN